MYDSVWQKNVTQKSNVARDLTGSAFSVVFPSTNCLTDHRIFEGQDGGTYDWNNILTTCALCHRKCHTGIIKDFGQAPFFFRPVDGSLH
jgi:hypothetical protein